MLKTAIQVLYYNYLFLLKFLMQQKALPRDRVDAGDGIYARDAFPILMMPATNQAYPEKAPASNAKQALPEMRA